MPFSMDRGLLDLSCAAAWLLSLIPTLFYLRTGWVARRERLLGVLTPKALKLYLEKFRQMQSQPDRAGAVLREIFGKEYGRRHYVAPILLLALVAGAGMWATTRTLEVWMSLTTNHVAFPKIAISGFLGAMAWVLNDQLQRMRTQDFTPYDVYGCAYRLLISVPIGYSLAAVAKDDFGVPLAFLLGAFPTTTLLTIARRVAAQHLGLGDSDEKAVTEIASLQGVGKAHAERFQEEGFSTIVELAWADPIDTTIRTNFDLWFVVDCVSQALLWVYLGPKVLELSRYSLRGAMEARYLLMDLNSDDASDRLSARTTVDEVAALLKMKPESLIHTLEEISRDPYTEFLCDIWDEQPGAPAGEH